MTINQVSAAESIAGVMAAVRGVAKKGRNEQQRFNFRGIDAVMNAVGPALREVGGFIVPRVVSREVERGVTKSGTPTVEMFLEVEFAWFGTDGGEPIVGRVFSEAMDTSDKATAKAMSVAYRTFLLQALTLPTDERDPDEDYIERGGQPKGRAAKAPAAKPAGPSREEVEAVLKSVAAETDLQKLRGLYREASEKGWMGLVVDQAGTTVEHVFMMRKQALEQAGESGE